MLAGEGVQDATLLDSKVELVLGAAGGGGRPASCGVGVEADIPSALRMKPKK